MEGITVQYRTINSSLSKKSLPQSRTIADSGSLHECSDRSSPPAAGSGYNGPQAVEVCPTEAEVCPTMGTGDLRQLNDSIKIDLPIENSKSELSAVTKLSK